MVADAVEEYVFTAQIEQLEEPELEYLPTTQDRQTLDVDPVEAKYLPAPQEVHTVFPALPLYVPAGQVVQKRDFVAAEYDPAEQLVQQLEATKPQPRVTTLLFRAGA